jgi:hypothetical protein
MDRLHRTFAQMEQRHSIGPNEGAATMTDVMGL